MAYEQSSAQSLGVGCATWVADRGEAPRLPTARYRSSTGPERSETGVADETPASAAASFNASSARRLAIVTADASVTPLDHEPVKLSP